MTVAAAMIVGTVLGLSPPAPLVGADAAPKADKPPEESRIQRTTQNPKVRRAIDLGLQYLAKTQARSGLWTAEGGMYPVAMTALAGMAFLLDGNTTLQGRYAKNVQSAVSFLLDQSQKNGLIGDPVRDNRYMYGHGFSMLFLSEVLGEEEDAGRRKQIIDVLTRAVEFSGRAQTVDGGWGYVSARDGRGFDEGR